MRVKGQRVKLQEQPAYESGGEQRYKYLLVVPKEAIEKLSLQKGQYLKWEVSGGKLVYIPVKGKEGP
jgi:hypothetical protein